MEDVTTKCRNTAKMLGASSLESLNFGDACFILRNNINQELLEKARQTILKTELLENKFKNWLNIMYIECKSINYKSNKSLPITKKVSLMSREETINSFGYGIVLEILSTLITKQFHDDRL